MRVERTGTWCIWVSFLFLVFLFAPVMTQEIRYAWGVWSEEERALSNQSSDLSEASEAKDKAVAPVDKNFGLIIPKIDANTRVIPGIDWQDAKRYQVALTKGVAHAAGSALPGDGGNVFLFSHAGASPLEAWRYNAVFYLLDKLERGDRLELWYAGRPITYHVTEKKVVEAEAVQYIEGDGKGEKLTLMTCWPAGTTWKRLIVIAEPRVE